MGFELKQIEPHQKAFHRLWLLVAGFEIDQVYPEGGYADPEGDEGFVIAILEASRDVWKPHADSVSLQEDDTETDLDPPSGF